jgi:hypothetical protein
MPSGTQRSGAPRLCREAQRTRIVHRIRTCSDKEVEGTGNVHVQRSRSGRAADRMSSRTVPRRRRGMFRKDPPSKDRCVERRSRAGPTDGACRDPGLTSGDCSYTPYSGSAKHGRAQDAPAEEPERPGRARNGCQAGMPPLRDERRPGWADQGSCRARMAAQEARPRGWISGRTRLWTEPMCRDANAGNNAAVGPAAAAFAFAGCRVRCSTRCGHRRHGSPPAADDVQLAAPHQHWLPARTFAGVPCAPIGWV